MGPSVVLSMELVSRLESVGIALKESLPSRRKASSTLIKTAMVAVYGSAAIVDPIMSQEFFFVIEFKIQKKTFDAADLDQVVDYALDGVCRFQLSQRPPKCPFRNLPVCDALHAATCSGVPETTIWPPAWPPSGPRSITWSAVLMTSM